MALTQKLLDFMFDTRICPGCKIEKPARPEYFHRSKAYSCGYSYCKACAAKDRDSRRERRYLSFVQVMQRRERAIRI